MTTTGLPPTGVDSASQQGPIPAPVLLDDEFSSVVAASDPTQALARSIQSALSTAGYSHLREVVVELQRGRLVLEGRVPTYYQKQLAQEIAQRVARALTIVNSIEVVIRSGESWSS